MNVRETALPGVLVVEPPVFADARGYFFESHHAERYDKAGIVGPFIQDNVSFSRRGVLRGLHVQVPRGQGKLVCVLRGEVFDVAVDIRRGSPTFGKWIGETLSSENRRQLWVPAGFAHGFMVTSEEALVAYKCTEYYAPATERTVRWNDPQLNIAWPGASPTLSDKDRAATTLAELHDDLPLYASAR